MKRLGNLYENIYKFENINSAFNEVCRNTKNKRRVYKLKEYKCIYIARITKILKNREYKPGPCNVFTIYEPKERRIVSQNMQDKVINHLVARHILHPALFPCLLDVNVASRKSYGTAEGIRLAKAFHKICKIKYDSYYILKCDISKFFASIDHDILKEKLKRRIKDKDALKIVFDIIDAEEHGLSIGYRNYFVMESCKIKYLQFKAFRTILLSIIFYFLLLFSFKESFNQFNKSFFSFDEYRTIFESSSECFSIAFLLVSGLALA